MRAYLIVQAGADPDFGGADALVIDGRATPPPSSRTAGDATRREGAATRRLVRVDDIDAPDLDACLADMAALEPDAVILSARHGRDVAHLGSRLAVHEAERGLLDGAIGIVALVSCAAGVLAAGSFTEASPRLLGLGWDAVALARQLGAELAVTEGSWVPPLAHARVMVRLAAAAAGIEAVEAACPGDDAEELRALVAAARRDGFGAMFAHDAAQVRLIHAGA